MQQSKRQYYDYLRGQLELDRSSFLSHWRELGEYILPRRPRFQVTDANRGEKRNQKIIDSTATLAARTLQSGMMAGITSPARPWFRLTHPNPELAEVGAVKRWLHDVSQEMGTVFLKSNLYNVLPTVYGDLGNFATAALYAEEDMDDVIRFYPFPIGSYLISNNDKLKVDTVIRDFRMTVRQIVEEFGMRDDGSIDWKNISIHVKNMWEMNNREAWIDICHVVAPNRDYDPRKSHAKYKRYASCYYERGYGGGYSASVGSGGYLGSTEDDKFLRESGYDIFPIMVPRWEVTGEDSWGTNCPGMICLGDVKALQLMEKRKQEAIEKIVRPPMIAPTSLKSVKASILPGDITYSDREGMGGFRPAYEVNPRLQELMLVEQEHQKRIKSAFFEDLILMMSTSDRRDITAREIDERKEEKLLAFGPVLEQLNQDLLDPLIDITFQFMLAQDRIPPPPDELMGVPLKVEYISVMAQAQKLVGLAGIERFFGFVNNAAQINPAVLDKVNSEQAVDVYGDMTSVPPSIIRTDEEVAVIRADRAKQQQAAQQAQLIEQGAAAARNLSQANMGTDNALTRLVGG